LFWVVIRSVDWIFALAGRLEGAQRDVQPERVEDVGERQADGAVERGGRQVDGVAAERTADALRDRARGIIAPSTRILFGN